MNIVLDSPDGFYVGTRILVGGVDRLVVTKIEDCTLTVRTYKLSDRFFDWLGVLYDTWKWKLLFWIDDILE